MGTDDTDRKDEATGVTVADIEAYFESLTCESAMQLSRFYCADARFKDPFNDVTGLAEIARIYLHMFDQLHEPRFVITGRWERPGGVILAWDFRFRMKRFDSARTQVIHGVSQLEFAGDGRIRLHRDYWDAAEELYEKLPVLGALMRFLKRQANS
jgi:hypothetical protein